MRGRRQEDVEMIDSRMTESEYLARFNPAVLQEEQKLAMMTESEFLAQEEAAERLVGGNTRTTALNRLRHRAWHERRQRRRPA